MDSSARLWPGAGRSGRAPAGLAHANVHPRILRKEPCMASAGSPDFSAIIMLCDSVACPEGKLYIQGGGWQTLQSDRYPVRIPRIGVAVIVTVPYARTNERHELSLSFRNGEGRDL